MPPKASSSALFCQSIEHFDQSVAILDDIPSKMTRNVARSKSGEETPMTTKSLSELKNKTIIYSLIFKVHENKMVLFFILRYKCEIWQFTRFQALKLQKQECQNLNGHISFILIHFEKIRSH